MGSANEAAMSKTKKPKHRGGDEPATTAERTASVHEDSERLGRNRKIVISTRVEPLESKRKAGSDLAWIVVGSIVLIVVSIAFSLVDHLLNLESALNTRNFNGLIAVLLIAPVGASIFANRRYKEGMQAQRTLTNLSVTDAMTGLPNRRFLGEKFTEFLQAHQAGGSRIAVMFIDLDGFTAIDDTYGHEVGDKLMEAVGDRLRRSIKVDDVAVRYAGDEFVVIVTDVPSAQIAERIAGRLIKVIKTPFELGTTASRSALRSASRLPSRTAPTPATSSGTRTLPCIRPKATGPARLRSSTGPCATG